MRTEYIGLEQHGGKRACPQLAARTSKARKERPKRDVELLSPMRETSISRRGSSLPLRLNTASRSHAAFRRQCALRDPRHPCRGAGGNSYTPRRVWRKQRTSLL
jgi:hypothetical protein